MRYLITLSLLLILSLVSAQIVVNGNWNNYLNNAQDWGGGEDYPRLVTYSKVDFKTGKIKFVKTKNELKEALKNAKPGQIIYIDDNVEIDLSGEKELNLNEGVTLASGRGKNGSLGALLYCTNLNESYNLFHLRNNNTRITGLRLRGPDPYEKPPHGEKDVPACILIGDDFAFNEENNGDLSIIKTLYIEVDNNEIWAWPRCCVGLNGASEAVVRYNYIHNNLRDYDGHGFGYGIEVNRGHLLVEKNIFSSNRHDIASNGHPLSNYTFRNNLVLQGGTHHSIDVHGWFESATISKTVPSPNGIGTTTIKVADPTHRKPNGTCYAGNNFIVEGNIILEDFNWFKSTFWAYNMLIRGIPEGSVQVRNNKFAQHKNVAIGQAPDGGLDVSNRIANVFDVGVFSKTKISIADDNQFGVDYSNAIFVAFSGRNYWTFRKFESLPLVNSKTWSGVTVSTPNMAVGDFDGDGKADLFYADGQKWFVSNKGKSDFQIVNQANVRLDELQLGDFDGDGKTDVLYKNNENFYFAKSATTLWNPLIASTDKINNVRLGDFNGDGKTDIFRKIGDKWEVSYSGIEAWKSINVSNANVTDLLFGDFNGDKKTDILWVHDGKWLVSWAAQTQWEQINTSDMNISSLKIGDFNGDGQADLFNERGKEWFVSWSGRSKWEKINSSGYTARDFIFGDFNGDKKTDVMVSFNKWR